MTATKAASRRDHVLERYKRRAGGTRKYLPRSEPGLLPAPTPVLLDRLNPVAVTSWDRKGDSNLYGGWPSEAHDVGIYGIYHRATNSIYIGYTADVNGFKARWNRHKRVVFTNRAHTCQGFQNLVNKLCLMANDFELVILKNYSLANGRTQDLCDSIVQEEVLEWDRAKALGFTMLNERPSGALRAYR